jgi:hypothetical protein
LGRIVRVKIRPATSEDAAEIAELLRALGYPSAPLEVERRLSMLDSSDAVLLTAGGMIVLHRIPRLAEGVHLDRGAGRRAGTSWRTNRPGALGRGRRGGTALGL